MKNVLIIGLLLFVVLISGCTTGTTTGETLQIKTKELPQWISEETATYKPEVVGGKPDYRFSIGEGTSLPQGFNLGPDGTIGGSGTLAPGSSKSVSPPFTFVVTDSAGNTAKISYTIVITEPPIGISPQEVKCTVNQKCNEVIATAARGAPPYTFQSDTFREGTPPPGTIIDVNGRLTGTPTKAGEYTVGVCVKDTVANSKCGHAKVIITEAPTLSGIWTGQVKGLRPRNSIVGYICYYEGNIRLSLSQTGSSLQGSITYDLGILSDKSSIYCKTNRVSGTSPLTGNVRDQYDIMPFDFAFTTSNGWNIKGKGNFISSTNRDVIEGGSSLEDSDAEADFQVERQ